MAFAVNSATGQEARPPPCDGLPLELVNGQQAAGHAKVAAPTTAIKRPRGRPRIERPDKLDRRKRSDDQFEAIVAEIKNMPKDLWPIAKDECLLAASEDQRMPHSAIRVINYLVVKFNRDNGCDRHSVKKLAAKLGLTLRTTERALNHLERCGHILRRIVDVHKGRGSRDNTSKRGLTTLPGLAAGARIASARRNAKRVAERNHEGPATKIVAVGTTQAHLPTNKSGPPVEGPDKNGGGILKEEENPGTSPVGRADELNGKRAFNRVATTQTPAVEGDATKLLRHLRKILVAKWADGADRYQNWLIDLEFVDLRAGCLTVRTATPHRRKWIEQEYVRDIEAAGLAAFGLPVRTVNVELRRAGA